MNQTRLDTVLTQAQQLSLLDKVRLVERLMSTLERDLQPPQPRRSLLGLWSDVRISAEEIDAARHEMWDNFPREDI
jgi:hypothetical protein